MMMLKKVPVPLKCDAKAPIFLVVALVLGFAPPLGAATWKKPALLSSNDATQPDAAIDSDGNVVSVWVEKPDTNGSGQIWTKSRTNAIWTAASALDLTIDSHNPNIEISATGNATAVWSNSAGIWSANRPEGRNWTVPKLLVPTPTSGLGRTKFAMNSQGDALLTWVEGSHFGLSVNFMKRPANAAWSLPAVVAANVSPFVVLQGGDGVDLNESIIWENGDALTAWTRYGIHPHGYKLAQQLQVSRLQKTGTAWQSSPTLGTVETVYYYDTLKTSLLLDVQGRAGVVFNTPDANLNYNWVIAKQTGANQSWSTPSIMPIDNADTTCDQLITLTDIVGCWKDYPSEGSARSDAKGNITFMYTDRYGYYDSWDGTYYASRTRNITGNLGSTTWTAPSTLLAYNDSSNYWNYGSYLTKYDVGANGAGVFAWPWYNATTFSPLLKVKMRASATSSWSSSLSYNFNTTNNTGKVLDVKVNQNGNTSILYENFDSLNHLLYVVTYN